VRPCVQMPVQLYQIPSGDVEWVEATSGSAAELKASGAEKATAICWSFPIRNINKQGFNFIFNFMFLTSYQQVGASSEPQRLS